MSKARRIKPRSDTLASWTAANPVLELYEIAIESDSGKIKFGDGAQNYNDLLYFIATLPTPMPIHTVTNAPDATLYTGSFIYVTDDTGGAVQAFSDGTNWLRCTDRNAISL